MLADSLAKAFGTAERMISIARTKSTAATLPPALAGASNNWVQSQMAAGSASACYGSNRGWVYACVRLVANRIAGQTIRVAKVNASPVTAGGMMTKAARQSLPMRLKGVADHLEPLDSHPLLDLLADPWELGTAHSLMFTTVASLELCGRSLWYVSSRGTGKASILPIPAHWIHGTDAKRSVWKIQIPGSASPMPLPGDQCVHFFYPDPANPWGVLSPLEAIAQAVAADESISEAQWRVFKQAQFPGIAITVGGQPSPNGEGIIRPELTAEQRQQLVESVRRHYTSVQQLGEPLIFDRLVEKVEKLTLAPDEMDFLDSAKLTKSRILQGYGVSPILLGEVEGANRASATVADEIFCANKVNPLITLLSQSMEQWLSPLFARDGERLAIWIEEATPHDSEMTAKLWDTATRNRFVTPNEYRRTLLNLPDIEGGDKLPQAPAALAATAPPDPDSIQDTAAKYLRDLNPYSLKALNGE